MAVKSKMLAIASVSTLIQSLIWIPACISAVLVYLCEIKVPSYKESSDFFRVTLVKLYFEGPQCKLDGSYLGQFNLDYRDPDKISLTTPDIIFAVMLAYIFLHFFQLFLSISVYRYNENGKKKNLLFAVVNWSIITLCISALDAFLLVEFIWDTFNLIDYINNTPSNGENDIKGIEFIPVILSIFSSRLILLWLFNVYTAMSYFLCGACCQKVLGIKEEEKVIPPPKPSPQPDPPKPEIYTIPPPPPSDINKVVGRITTFDTHSGLTRRKDWDIYSRKTVTYFNDYSGRLPQVKGEQCRRSFDNKEVEWNPSKKLYQCKDDAEKKNRNQEKKKELEILNMDNEAFVNDEPIFVEEVKDKDFAHRFENFDQGQKKQEKQKPPLGKYVPPPVPPSASDDNSCNC